MSFQRSSALESQPTSWRREDDAAYADDPEFRDFADKLSDDLFALTRNVARLSQETAKLGTKHETARVRERVKTTVEETSDKFKELGESLKKITTWPDVGLDIIEENVETTHDASRGAHINLKQASNYQKSARSKACILLLILAIVLVIIILAVVLD
ncbi:hypothetical protein GGP41_003402 [Bipolaris sorokiniana]|uniref:t-SNARE coiled-coil homology domain-containing protein n=1 Tax=Cochliobolus sativus TaxID=45130 RepID=A0A8H5ZFG1_COCSA|nr:hypothetical protein GGP41_003402 [Bipolaris sorokiniana]